MRFDESPAFGSAIEGAANSFGIAPDYVLKDYYVAGILRSIGNEGSLVFKGGSSLSMCCQLIHRFSEDIDLAFSLPGPSRSQKRKCKELILSALEKTGLTLLNPGEQRTRRMLNKFRCHYGGVGSVLHENSILVELAAQTPAFPVNTGVITPLVGQFLLNSGKKSIVEEFGIGPFSTHYQSPSRTFVDKLFAICDYYLLGKTFRVSRHLYDIHCLYRAIELDESFKELFLQTRSYRKNLDSCPSAREGVCVSKLLETIASSSLFEEDYRLATYPLLYESVSYLECLSSLKEISQWLLLNNL